MDATRALEAARHALDGSIAAQSAVLAFRDCYLVILVLFVLLSPLIPLMRRPPGAAFNPGRAIAEH